MALQPKPTLKTQLPKTAVDAFIEAAPDARAPAPRPAGSGTRSGVARGRKEQISLTLAPGLIDQVDEKAAAMGLSRAAWISAAIYRALQVD